MLCYRHLLQIEVQTSIDLANTEVRQVLKPQTTELIPCIRVILEKLMVTQSVNIFSNIYGTSRLILNEQAFINPLNVSATKEGGQLRKVHCNLTSRHSISK